MAMGYGAESIGLRMAELSSAVAANIKYALDRLKEGRDPATVTAAEMVVAYADASEQSAQMRVSRDSCGIALIMPPSAPTMDCAAGA